MLRPEHLVGTPPSLRNAVTSAKDITLLGRLRNKWSLYFASAARSEGINDVSAELLSKVHMLSEV